jgi:hypothetical protein
VDVRYVDHLGLRVELEQLEQGERRWWRARVTRSPEGAVTAPLPWSYAPVGEQALGDAVLMLSRVTLAAAAAAAASKKPLTGAAARRARTAAQEKESREAAESTVPLPPARARERVTVTIRCEECGGEGTIPLGPETARQRQCPRCRGAGTLRGQLSLEEFRALRERWGF